MKQLTDDYLKPKNDSFINSKVNVSDTVEDIEKEERYFNFVRDAKKDNN
jgi:hypothetical protein